MYFLMRSMLSGLLALLSAVAVAQNIVSNPTTSQTINQPSGTSFTVKGTTNLQNLSNMNNVLWVDGANYKTLEACYAALSSSTGGTCMVPPNFTETLSNTLIMNKSGAGFRFTGPAQITLAASPTTTCGNPAIASGVVISEGVIGAFIVSDTPPGFDQQSTTFIAPSGFNGNAFCAGSSSGNTINLTMRNIRFDISPPSTISSVGVYLARVTGCEMDNVNVVGNSASNTTQRGFVLDGTGTNGFAGYCTFINPSEGGVNIGIQFTGTGGDAGNASTIINNTITGLSGSNPTCIDFQAGSGQNVVIGGDCENLVMGTAVHFEGTSGGNEVWLRDENITGHSVVFESGTDGNIVHMLVPLPLFLTLGFTTQ